MLQERAHFGYPGTNSDLLFLKLKELASNFTDKHSVRWNSCLAHLYQKNKSKKYLVQSDTTKGKQE